LNECIGRPAKSEKIEKINANGITTDVPLEIANELNNSLGLKNCSIMQRDQEFVFKNDKI